MAESNNKEFLYVLIGVGITLLAVATILSFLTYRKVDRQPYDVYNVPQELNRTQTLNQTSPVIYDERVYKMLVDKIDDRDNKIHEHIEDINSNINSLKLQYKIPSIDSIGKPSKAGSVTTIRTTTEDKIRQKDFGMI